MVTNNPKCKEKLKSKCRVDFDMNRSYGEVLIKARDLIHSGKVLITHPMASSLKPNQTPYRSIVLSDETLEAKEDFEDVLLIENALDCYDKFMNNRKLFSWSDKIKGDFQTIDLDMIENALRNIKSEIK